jgi:hypothetical protein
MESPQTTISGDLPIRLARPKQLSPVQETEEPTQSVDIQDLTEPLGPKPKPAVDPKFLEDEAARQIDVSTILPGNKKRANKKPKSKRGRVMASVLRAFRVKVNQIHRMLPLDLRISMPIHL